MAHFLATGRLVLEVEEEKEKEIKLNWGTTNSASKAVMFMDAFLTYRRFW
jgi:hypothetical protein